jgi:hypothetical protein
MTATTTLCFVPSAEVLSDITASFRVQVVGVDASNQGISHSTFAKAMKYATAANSNGHTCFIHLA